MGWKGPPDCSRRWIDEGTRHGGKARVWRKSPLMAPNMLREDMLVRQGQDLGEKRWGSCGEMLIWRKGVRNLK
jgi:hypothetical protein